MIPYNCPLCGTAPTLRAFSVGKLIRMTYGCPKGCCVIPNKFKEYSSVLVLPNGTSEEEAIREWNLAMYVYAKR